MSSRLDVELVRRGLVRSRSQAQEAIQRGQVLLNGAPAAKPAIPVTDADALVVTVASGYVSRAAHKLAGALVESGTLVPPRVLDAGAATGGFTQVVLEAGAERVYAVDVGHGQLAEEVRTDPRVRVRERTNLRDLTRDQLDGDPVGLVVADVSFISLRLLLRPLLSVLDPDGVALLMVKPQFEVGRGGLDARGVVRSPAARRATVDAVSADAAQLGWREVWRGESRLPGEAGNVEYFLKLVSENGNVGGRD